MDSTRHSKVEISAFTLFALSNVILDTWNAVETFRKSDCYNHSESEDYHSLFQQHSLNTILNRTNDIIDEYRDHFYTTANDPEDEKQKVYKVKEYFKIIFSGINKWEIKNYRHWFGAHNFRIGEKGPSIWSTDLSDFHVPNTLQEFEHLVWLIFCMNSVLSEFFGTSIVAQQSEMPVNEKQKPGVDCAAERKRITAEINDLIAKHTRN